MIHARSLTRIHIGQVVSKKFCYKLTDRHPAFLLEDSLAPINVNFAVCKNLHEQDRWIRIKLKYLRQISGDYIINDFVEKVKYVLLHSY